MGFYQKFPSFFNQNFAICFSFFKVKCLDLENDLQTAYRQKKS